jgi:hypothetical protein
LNGFHFIDKAGRHIWALNTLHLLVVLSCCVLVQQLSPALTIDTIIK